MTERKVWATSDNGTIEYISLTVDYLEDTLSLLRRSFYQNEAGLKAIRLVDDPDAMDEFDIYVKDATKEGVSIIAVEKQTNIVCGVVVNKIHVQSPNEDHNSYYTKFLETFKRPKSKAVLKYMEQVDNLVNMFEHSNCILEILFLSTSPDFIRRGIAFQLCLATTELVKMLKLEKRNVKQPLDHIALPLEPVPDAMIAYFTSKASQNIGKKLNWDIIGKASFEEFKFEGKTFSSILGSDYEYILVQYKNI